MKALVTGGAGFIGSNLIKKIAKIGWEVDVIDILSDQVHGKDPAITSPTYASISSISNIIVGDAADVDTYSPLMNKTYDSIVCLAAETGTGQSMYEAEKHCRSNIVSIAVLNDLIVNKKIKTKNIVLASSRSVYGDAILDAVGNPKASKETDLTEPRSIYAASKLAQENLLSIGFGDIPAVMFRFQNVYGPGQSLVNPYTGILSIFTTSIINKEPINIFEDGLMSRDFIFIDDIVEGLILGMSYNKNQKIIVNLGSGTRKTVLDVVNELSRHFDVMPPVQVTGQKRAGDIRHNFADLTRANELSFSPKVNFEEGIRRFVDWAKTQPIAESNYEKSLSEMRHKGLLK
jgi:dTDP-L-rhamnose 4-epimerase